MFVPSLTFHGRRDTKKTKKKKEGRLAWLLVWPPPPSSRRLRIPTNPGNNKKKRRKRHAPYLTHENFFFGSRSENKTERRTALPFPHSRGKYRVVSPPYANEGASLFKNTTRRTRRRRRRGRKFLLQRGVRIHQPTTTTFWRFN